MAFLTVQVLKVYHRGQKFPSGYLTSSAQICFNRSPNEAGWDISSLIQYYFFVGDRFNASLF